jgi:hypothetical protein
MSREELTDAGFFADTMSVAVQATTASHEGLTTESGFVAGVKTPGGNQHDKQTVDKVAANLGADYSNKSATEIIDTPMLIHKSLMPNGVIDLVKLYDEAAGGTFFGESKPIQDYSRYLEFCKQREESYLPKIQLAMGELLAEAPNIKTPTSATRKLHKVSEKNMLAQAVYDKNINPLVFGREAAFYIERARLHSDHGNTELADVAIKKAQPLARSSSCPSGVKSGETAASEVGVNKKSETETWHGGKKHYNAKCNCCKKVKSQVGACHICEDCVKNPGKMQAVYDKEKGAAGKLAQIIPINKKQETKEEDTNELAALDNESQQLPHKTAA